LRGGGGGGDGRKGKMTEEIQFVLITRAMESFINWRNAITRGGGNWE